MVERRQAVGRVMFISSGFDIARWNVIANTNAFMMFDRVMRSWLSSTLPQRNFTAQDRIALPVVDAGTRVEYELMRPSPDDEAGEDYTETETLDVSFIGASRKGVILKDTLQRGIYRVAAYERPDEEAGPDAQRKKLWEIPISVGGEDSVDEEQSESEVAPLSVEEFRKRAGDVEGSKLRWIGFGDEVSLAGVQIRGQNLWKWLILAVLVALLAEMAILAWPTDPSGPAATGPKLTTW